MHIQHSNGLCDDFCTGYYFRLSQHWWMLKYWSICMQQLFHPAEAQRHLIEPRDYYQRPLNFNTFLNSIPLQRLRIIWHPLTQLVFFARSSKVSAFPYIPSSWIDKLPGDIPSFKLFESDKVLAFLDIQPLSRGHAVCCCPTQVKDLELMSV